MTDKQIRGDFDRDGYVVVKDIIDERELDPIRDFIASKVDEFAIDKHGKGELTSLHEHESFERRFAAICKELDINPRGWEFGSFGREFYDLYTLPGVLKVLRLLLGPEVSNLGRPSLRTKLPDCVITSFPWHQDSQYVDQKGVGVRAKHTEHLPMVTVWVPLVEATIENGCCGVLPSSHRWGLLGGVRGEDHNIRMEEDVEAKGVEPVPVPLEPGGALFLSNLCVHTSKLNTTDACRWSIDYRYFPTPGRASLTPPQRKGADFVQNMILEGGGVPLIVISENERPTWEEWEREVQKASA